MPGLSKFNYVFGTNGTGKTTLSRILADAGTFRSSSIIWQHGRKLETAVYNRDFVERNFSQSAVLKGVFTLGEDRVETLAQITAKEAEIVVLETEIVGLTRNVGGNGGTGGKKGELRLLDDGFTKRCWAAKLKHDLALQGGFEGFRNSKEHFKSKVLSEAKSNGAALLSLSELETRSATVFGPTPSSEPPLANADLSGLLAHETDSILSKRVSGKEDVDIAAMIKKLGNSDWVRQGRRFYDANGGTCPFCQQPTPGSLAASLNEYFDDAFDRDMKAIDRLADAYKDGSARIQEHIGTLLANPSRFLDVDKLRSVKDLLDTTTALNLQRLADKKREPGRIIGLEPLGGVDESLRTVIDAANVAAAKHNQVVTNLAAERTRLTAQVWRFVVEELKPDLAAYTPTRTGIDKAIAGMNGKLEVARTKKAACEAELQALQKQTTSTRPTADDINNLLKSFGFTGFALAVAGDGMSYLLVRSDGADAKPSLSEGERTFVTFLYFYHLLKGSNNATDVPTDRVVVFDDPVSSLDSDVLFIVSSLIKGLFEDIRNCVGHIKQIFVLTHNVYFHKEITFNPKRSQKDETFWVVRKPEGTSMVVSHPTNPVTTAYELLWVEVRNPDRALLTIQNVLRRILENYFKILGHVDPDDICSKFDGKAKQICRSLFSWVNAGSHHAFDDLYVATGDAAAESYLAVFKDIFDKSGHLAHYRMMMGEGLSGPPVDAEAAV
jgi:wobble nucleotide-excising tRNase